MTTSRSTFKFTLMGFLIALAIMPVLFLTQCRNPTADSTDNDNLSDSIRAKAAKWEKLEKLSQDYLQTRTTISSATAQRSMPFSDAAMARTYIAEFAKDTTTCLATLQGGKEPTTSVWVDLETLASLVKFIIDKEGDGARLYFAKYPALENVPDPLRKDTGTYDNKYMIIMNSTKLNDEGDHQSFYEKVQVGEMEVCLGLYNYNDMCPPKTCKGNVIP